MHPARSPVTVPPMARARALGAMVPRGDHALALAPVDADSVLLGFCLANLEAGRRVLVLAGGGSPRALRQRLRAGGAAATMARPGALSVLDLDEVPGHLAPWLRRQARRAVEEHHEGLAVAHVVGPGALARARRDEPHLPRRLPPELTVLCVYPGRTLDAAGHGERNRGLAASHARILYL